MVPPCQLRREAYWKLTRSCWLPELRFPTSRTVRKYVSIVYFFFIYFYQLEANYFTILQWFLSYIGMNQPWIYIYSPSQYPLPPPSPPDPSGSSQCTSPEHLSHASNLGWWSVSPLIVTCFNAVLSEHPTLAFSHRVRKSVLYICVSFFCFAYRVIITIFLNSIYMHQLVN